MESMPFARHDDPASLAAVRSTCTRARSTAVRLRRGNAPRGSPFSSRPSRPITAVHQRESMRPEAAACRRLNISPMITSAMMTVRKDERARGTFMPMKHELPYSTTPMTTAEQLLPFRVNGLNFHGRDGSVTVGAGLDKPVPRRSRRSPRCETARSQRTDHRCWNKACQRDLETSASSVHILDQLPTARDQGRHHSLHDPHTGGPSSQTTRQQKCDSHF